MAGKKKAFKAGKKLYDRLTGKSLKRESTVGKAVRNGRLVGAPEWVKSKKDLAKLRAQLKNTLEEGLIGRDWYINSHNALSYHTGGDPTQQARHAAMFGATSQDSSVPANTTFALRAGEKLALGKVPQEGRYPKSIGKRLSSLLEDEIPDTGLKTGAFTANLIDPEAPFSVNDFRIKDLFQYGKKKGGLSPSQHEFVSKEIGRLADWANKRKLGGFDDWTPGRVQASLWVRQKAGEEMRKAAERGKHLSLDEALQQAAMDFSHAFDDRYAYVNYEYAPGASTGHLKGILGDKKAVEDLSAVDPFSSAPGGRDVIYDSFGLLGTPTKRVPGIYMNSQGVVETNPAFSFGVPVGHIPARPKEEIPAQGLTPEARRLFDTGESFRSYMAAQEMGSYHKPIQLPGLPNDAITLLFENPSALTKEDVTRLYQQTSSVFPTDTLAHAITPHGLDVWDYMGTTDPRALRSALRKAGIEPKPRQLHITGGAPDFSGDLAEKNAGTGVATKRILSLFSDEEGKVLREKLDNPRVREAVLRLAERDDEIARRYGYPVREDIQNARRVFAESGFDGLKKALKEGTVPLPAVAAVVTDAEKSSAESGPQTGLPFPAATAADLYGRALEAPSGPELRSVTREEYNAGVGRRRPLSSLLERLGVGLSSTPEGEFAFGATADLARKMARGEQPNLLDYVGASLELADPTSYVLYPATRLAREGVRRLSGLLAR